MASDHLRDLCLELTRRPPLQQLDFIYENPILMTDNAVRTFLEMAVGRPDAEAAWFNVNREFLRKALVGNLEDTYHSFQQVWDTAIAICELLLETPTLRVMQRVVEGNPSLLTDIGVSAMYYIQGREHRQKGEEYSWWPGIHMIFLFKCRQFGVDFAIGELRTGQDDYWFVETKPW